MILHKAAIVVFLLQDGAAQLAEDVMAILLWEFILFTEAKSFKGPSEPPNWLSILGFTTEPCYIVNQVDTEKPKAAKCVDGQVWRSVLLSSV